MGVVAAPEATPANDKKSEQLFDLTRDTSIFQDVEGLEVEESEKKELRTIHEQLTTTQKASTSKSSE
eukprot:5873240-Pyramimonas_sp.AAC.1